MNPLIEKAKLLFIPTIVLAYIGAAQAHNGEDDEHEPVQAISSEEIRREKIQEINEMYKEKVRAIFQDSCFNCHSQKTQYPWYYKFPIVRRIIDGDVREAKRHLDLTYDFPFKGHGSPEKDFKAIKNVLNKKNMPPFRYRIMHWGSGLSENELKLIMNWIKDSRKILREH